MLHLLPCSPASSIDAMDDQVKGAFFSAPYTPYLLNRQFIAQHTSGKATVTDTKALLEPASSEASFFPIPSDSMISELPLHPNPLATFATQGSVLPVAFETLTTTSNVPTDTLYMQQEPLISLTPSTCSPTKGSRGTKWATEEDWDLHKVTICRLYLDENMALAEVRDIMQQQYVLHAT
jgi:hypothetical protein